MTIQTVFERTEKKYILTLEQRRLLLEKIASYIKPDEYGESTVCSLYFDTPDSRLIRSSMEKPIYKEKLRLRSYSTPKRDSNVFLELKKKYNGVVYKRRQTMSYQQAQRYLTEGELPVDSQVMREIDWSMRYYKDIAPKVFIAYDRTAFYSKTDRELRITFDRNVRFRTDHLDLAKGHYGERILDPQLCIMEIKALSAMPLWLTEVLTELQLFPGTFSKYGTAYRLLEERKNRYKGGRNCA
ncbi:MAG: polyphosphate polymerase domain-containing protein [Ruminococcus sp.]|nr:polyphosphate polymerase domain-containing protein [Ruminococcus sp.]